MKLFVKPNLEKSDAAACAERVADTVSEIAQRLGQAVTVLFDESARGYIRAQNVVFVTRGEAYDACDIVIPIGGDGTVMRAARDAARAGKPIIGVNAGRVGFLTQLEAHELAELEKLFTGQYKVTSRVMLSAKIETEGGNVSAKSYIALNDVVVRHGDTDRIISFEVRCGERLVASHRADGVIFSTPTGSTAYSMSAGGPVVSPELDLIIMTAICPHYTAFSSSLVLSPQNAYTVRETAASGDSGMYVSLDGVRVCRLGKNGSVTISRSDIVAKFIDLGLREFYGNLNEKLKPYD